jgi:hypothetical protein
MVARLFALGNQQKEEPKTYNIIAYQVMTDTSILNFNQDLNHYVFKNKIRK